MLAEIGQRSALVGELEFRLDDGGGRAVVALFRARFDHELVDGCGLVPGQSREVKPRLTVGADRHVVEHVREGQPGKLDKYGLFRNRELRNGALGRSFFYAPASIGGLVGPAFFASRAWSRPAVPRHQSSTFQDFKISPSSCPISR